MAAWKLSYFKAICYHAVKDAFKDAPRCFRILCIIALIERERERERERLLWRPVHLIRIQLGHRSGTVRQLPHRLLSHSSIASAFVIIIIISLLLPSSFSPKGMRRLGSTHCVHVVLLIDSLLFSFFSPSSVYSPLFFFFFFSFLLSFFLDSV